MLREMTKLTLRTSPEHFSETAAVYTPSSGIERLPVRNQQTVKTLTQLAPKARLAAHFSEALLKQMATSLLNLINQKR